MKMTLKVTILLFLMLACFPFLSHSQDGSGSQPTQETPKVINPEQSVGQITPNPSAQPAQAPDPVQPSMRDHFRSCDQALNQARDQVHALSNDAKKHSAYDREALRRQHLQVQEELRTLKESHEKFLGDLNSEQRSSIQSQIETMQQLHQRIQDHLQTIDQQFTGSNLHFAVLTEEAKAAERDMKSYQKHLQEAGKTFNLLND